MIDGFVLPDYCVPIQIKKVSNCIGRVLVSSGKNYIKTKDPFVETALGIQCHFGRDFRSLGWLDPA